ncbi:Os02g0790101 [Oryza sativa Japonica Group]|uniref:Os02g0790101 protein n=1 Tax=Oryza sativa subsp. japonica TaxID=39947 RepID=A0A0P0VQH0_ORYSJ|nr:Os02g0790101 [Oryza sativa Japonica Group]
MVSVLRGSSDGRRRRQIWSPRLAGVIGDGLGRRRRRSADLAGRWLAAAMVADVAATKLATTVADCGACRDAGPHQEPHHHEGGAAPSSMFRL